MIFMFVFIFSLACAIIILIVDSRWIVTDTYINQNVMIYVSYIICISDVL